MANRGRDKLSSQFNKSDSKKGEGEWRKSVQSNTSLQWEETVTQNPLHIFVQ